MGRRQLRGELPERRKPRTLRGSSLWSAKSKRSAEGRAGLRAQAGTDADAVPTSGKTPIIVQPWAGPRPRGAAAPRHPQPVNLRNRPTMTAHRGPGIKSPTSWVDSFPFPAPDSRPDGKCFFPVRNPGQSPNPRPTPLSRPAHPLTHISYSG